MEIYWKILTIVLPVFALIGLGYILGYKSIIKKSSNADIENFILLIALPIMVFTYLIKYPPDIIMSLDYILLIVATLFLAYGIAILIAHKNFNNNSRSSAFHALLSSYSNSAYMGLPICLMAFGDTAIVPAVLFASIITITAYIPSIFICEWEKKERYNTGSLRQIELHLLRKIYTNPLFYAPLLALLWQWIGIDMPDAGQAVLEMISKSMIPMALVSIGASLYYIKKEHIQNINDVVTQQIGLICLFKLFIMPFLAYVIFRTTDIDPVWQATVIIQAAMPSSIGAYNLAIHHNIFHKQSGITIVYSMLGALISIPILLSILL